MKLYQKITLAGVLGLSAMAGADVALAQDAAPAVYIFNTLLFLIGGFLVMWMAAGFAMLEAGLVRSKNVSMQSLKNIALYSIAGIMYWLVGYNLMYTGVDGGFIGSFGTYAFDPVGGDALDETGYSTASDWFFQMVFVATAASIVSGTVAERMKLWPFLIFVVVLTGFIYPIAGSWQWGAGWLSEWASPTSPARRWCTRSVAGRLSPVRFCSVPRIGKYEGGKINPMPGSNIPLATLGTFILWLGWFGFNGASQLAMGTIGDVTDVSRIFANTNIAAAAVW
jgi:Amt family ammonium transporter